MGIVRAQIQTVEVIYRLVWTTVTNKSRSKPTTRAGIDYLVGTDWAGIGRSNFAYSATPHGGESRSGLDPLVRLQTGRSMALDKLSRVKLVEGAWRTAPNHSRPAFCVAEANIDAEDHPERDPQKGH